MSSFVLASGASCTLYSLFFYSYADHRDLHSFPTRRSSDLGALAEEDTQANGFGSRFFQGLDLERSGIQSHWRSEEHTSELQSQSNLVCRLLLEKKKKKKNQPKRTSHQHTTNTYATPTNRHI